jgi:trehalose-phosphatase
MPDSHDLPSALERLPEINRRLGERKLALFLDYDGTLTPIVERPELATIPPDTKRVVAELAERLKVAVISGRELADVRRLVGLENLTYAGSHGFEIDGPGGWHLELEAVHDRLPQLEEAENRLREICASLPGSLVERKRFSVAAHYRLVSRDDAPKVKQAVDEIVAGQPGLKLTAGKKVFELQPAVDWNKGRALLWLLDALEMDASSVMPIFLGDDITDESAFEAVAAHGTGIIVRDDPRETAATYALDSPAEVREFLSKLLEQERAHTTPK